MRKKLLGLLSIICAFVLCFLSACTNLTTLSFNDNFSNGNTPRTGYKEELEYNVEYDDKYYGLDSNISTSEISFNFSGKYISKLTAISSMPKIESDCFANIDSDIVSDIPIRSETFFVLETKLDVLSSYTINGETYNHNDTVYSYIIFGSKSTSYAPIYSATKSSFAVVAYSNQKFSYNITDSESEALYQKETYEIKIHNHSYRYSEIESAKDDLKALPYETKQYNNEYKRAIDNNELIFCLRNTNIELENSISLPTIAPSYGEYKALNVENSEEKEITLDNVNYNSIDFENETVGVKQIEYRVEDSNAAGYNKCVLIQKNASANLPNLALPVVIYEPLIIYQSFAKLGSLKLTLSKVVINN